MDKKILLAVNGTLMRGLKLNGNMIEAGAEFVKEAKTEKHYRCWSIEDDHPAMIKTVALKIFRFLYTTVSGPCLPKVYPQFC